MTANTTAQYPWVKWRSIKPSSWPPVVLVFALGLAVFGVPGPNWELGTLAVSVLLMGAKLLWRPGEAPIMLFAFGYQWLQATVQIFHANWLGLMVDDLAEFPSDLQSATLLSVLSCLFIALGLRLGAGAWRPQEAQQIRLVAGENSVLRWFQLYIAALLIAILVQSFAWTISGLAQPLLALAQLKWAFFWMLAYASFVQPAATKKYLLIAFAVELILGMSGYFSGFKQVFFVTLLALAASGVRLSRARKVGLVLLAMMLLLLGSVWSEIKQEYRHYISGGTGQQVVVVSAGERVAKLSELISGLDGNALAEGFDKLLKRTTYIGFFAVVLHTVPDVVPHSEGSLWWDAVSRPFMPRLFFPNKAVIDDSALVNEYTGLRVAGAERGTSISLGLAAESYIDFGAWAMFLPLFLLGWFGGRVYRWYLRTPKSRGPLGMGIVVVVLFPLAGLETSILKLVAAIILPVLASLPVIYYVAPRFFPWALVRNNNYKTRR